MTADPSRCLDLPAAWFVATTQGVVLAGPFDTRVDAVRARRQIVETLRAEMQRERFTGRVIAVQVRAVVVAFGVRVGAHGAFEPE